MILKMLRPKTGPCRAARQAAHHLADAAAHRAAQHRLSPLHSPVASLGCRVPLVIASLTDPIVQFAVDVIDKLGPARDLRADGGRERLHPDPVGGDVPVRGLQRLQRRVLDARGRGGRHARPTSSARGSPTRVGYYGRVDILEKHGKKLHIKPSHLAWADRWFEKYGDGTVFFTRMLPIIRTFISLPAGVARMPFWRFTVLTTLGCIPWIFMLTFIGRQVGDRWESWKDSLHYVDYAVAAMIVLGVVYLLVRNRRGAQEARGGRRAGRRCVALRSSRSGSSRARPSCCRSPRRATSPRCRGCWAGSTRELDGARRKEVEVALHAGGAVALLVGLRRELMALPLDVAVLSLLPAGGARRSRPSAGSRTRLGGPRSLAAGLVAGSVALVLADRRAAGSAREEDAGPRDGRAARARAGVRAGAGRLALGATLAAARALGFARPDAVRLSRGIGVPVLAGAAALKGRAAAAAAPGPLGARDAGAGAAAAPRRDARRAAARARARARRGRWRRGRPTAALLAGVLLVRENRER